MIDIMIENKMEFKLFITIMVSKSLFVIHEEKVIII